MFVCLNQASNTEYHRQWSLIRKGSRFDFLLWQLFWWVYLPFLGIPLTVLSPPSAFPRAFVRPFCVAGHPSLHICLLSDRLLLNTQHKCHHLQKACLPWFQLYLHFFMRNYSLIEDTRSQPSLHYSYLNIYAKASKSYWFLGAEDLLNFISDMVPCTNEYLNYSKITYQGKELGPRKRISTQIHPSPVSLTVGQNV